MRKKRKFRRKADIMVDYRLMNMRGDTLYRAKQIPLELAADAILFFNDKCGSRKRRRKP